MATGGKIASQVSAARTWIDGAVPGDESEGPGSGRVQMGLPATANRWPLDPDVLLGDGLYRRDGFTKAMRWSLPVRSYENVIGVVAGEDALPVRCVPAREVELVHPFELVRY